MMEWKKLKKEEAKIRFEEWDGETINCPKQYIILRKDLIDIFNEILKELNTDINSEVNDKYKFDLQFGLKFYTLLNNKYGFNLREACDDDVWRYISICVIPDIVKYRWKINEGRFWKESRRIYIKTLWWYVYLSWQGSKADTYKILKNNTTDEIVQLVERSGAMGYRVSLYRKIVKYYGNIDVKKRTRNIFRKVMKLNTARLTVVEPMLVHGGEDMYIKELFKYFEGEQ